MFEKKAFAFGEMMLPYRLGLPENYDDSKVYPLVLLLHGAGERGNDNERQLIHTSKFYLSNDMAQKHPAIIVVPQCPVDDYWSNVVRVMDSDSHIRYSFIAGGEPTSALNMVQHLLQFIIEKYRVDLSRVYIGGLSMGGMGTFEMVRRNPGLFAAAFPVCGGAHTDTAVLLKGTHWWLFHGEQDEEVPASFSIAMAEAMQAAGVDVKLSLYPEVKHNSWDNAFTDPNLQEWLFNQIKKG